jgi:hypothetical protein
MRIASRARSVTAVALLMGVLGVAASPAGRNQAQASSTADPVLAGTWQRLAEAPIAVDSNLTGVWTGTQLLVFGRGRTSSSSSANVAAAFDPTSRTWRRLAPPAGPAGSFEGRDSAVWSGHEMLVWGPFTRLAFDPATGRWRQLARAPLVPNAARAPSIVVWTGHEMIGWGGGCCGDAFADGAAYDPVSSSWRRIAAAPLAGSRSPAAAWTGRELVIVGGAGASGSPLRAAAAYDPTSDTWRRIAPVPEARLGATAIWDGHEILLVGGSAPPRGGTPAPSAAVGFAYDPATNRWRRLPPMAYGRFVEPGRVDASMVWTGTRLLLWGGPVYRGGTFYLAPHGLAYDPGANRWSVLPQAPLLGRLDPAAVWTGHALLVWGGAPLVTALAGTVGPADFWPFTDGATFTPAMR